MSEKSNWFIGEKPKLNVTQDQIRTASDSVLIAWSNDPQVVERNLCEEELINRRNEGNEEDPAQKCVATGIFAPFNPKTDISADAKHIAGRIVLNLWIICIVVPIALGLIMAALK